MKRDEIYAALIYKNGQDNQLNVAIEEMAELTKELTKMLRAKGNRMHLVEELSDVEICLAELKLIFTITEKEIELFKSFKIKRLEHYYLGDENGNK